MRVRHVKARLTRNYEGRTVIHYVAIEWREPVSRCLLDNMAGTKAKDHEIIDIGCLGTKKRMPLELCGDVYDTEVWLCGTCSWNCCRRRGYIFIFIVGRVGRVLRWAGLHWYCLGFG